MTPYSESERLRRAFLKQAMYEELDWTQEQVDQIKRDWLKCDAALRAQYPNRFTKEEAL